MLFQDIGFSRPIWTAPRQHSRPRLAAYSAPTPTSTSTTMPVEFTIEPPLAFITFNDPDALNAFTNEGASLLAAVRLESRGTCCSPLLIISCTLLALTFLTPLAPSLLYLCIV